MFLVAERIPSRASQLLNGPETAQDPRGLSLPQLYYFYAALCNSSPVTCSGAARVAARADATLLAMRDGMVPPTINVNEPDPEWDMDYVPAESRRLDVAYAVANCIAFGSKNSALVLKRAE
jgi:3-oxoacyl-[acyl-carrier-protein] synthase II